MEKIYIDNNNYHNKKRKIDGVSILAFFVAIFAVVSLVAVGFNQVTYAANSLQGDQLANLDSFNVKKETGNTDEIIMLSDTSFPVEMHYAELTCEGSSDGCSGGKKYIPVFCIQRNITFPENGDKSYKIVDNGQIKDVGFLYLVSNLYPNTELEAAFPIQGSDTNHKIDTWLTQAAIYYYLGKTGYQSDKQNMQDLDYQHVENAHYLKYGPNRNQLQGATTVGYTSEDHTLIDSYKVKGKNLTIRQLINKAIEYHNSNSSIYSLNVSAEGDVSVDTSEKYYFSKLINVQATLLDSSLGSFKGFSITIPDTAPADTIITNQEGEKIENLTNIAPGTKFYVRVPIDSVQEASKVEVEISANFDVAYADRFATTVTPESYQEITSLRFNPVVEKKPFEFEVAPAPDTGSSMAQTIYFIGLIVLLCGVGIVYANAKNKQVKE